LDHVALTLGLIVVQSKLRMLVSQNILNIYRAYAEWAWHFWCFRVLLSPLSMVYLVCVVHRICQLILSGN